MANDAPLQVPANAPKLTPEELQQIAEVTEADIEAAVKQWVKQNAGTYENILTAEPE